MKTTGTVRIGSGAGFAGDRIEPAVILAAQGRLDYLVLECLGERTIALAQLRRLRDPGEGYDPLLEARMSALLPLVKRNRVRLLTNMGQANPRAAGERAAEVARRLGVPVKIAVVTGDDVLDRLDPEARALESGRPLKELGEIVSANAYLGAEALLPALATGADVIITGRVADASLFVAPLAREFGWNLNDTTLMARATVVGHLLECAGQLTGGYYADPGVKDVPDMAHLGFPYADVAHDGTAVFSKVAGTGGVLNLRTAKEQLLYEVTEPAGYVTPDVVADFTTVRLRELVPDRVEASGATGRPRPDALKVSVGYRAGFIGEGEISYAGANAQARAELAGSVIRERLEDELPELRIDVIGVNAMHRTDFDHPHPPYEVRLRVAAAAATRELAERVGLEVEALYTNGPAGGGGVRRHVTERIGVASILLARGVVKSDVMVLEHKHAPQAA